MYNLHVLYSMAKKKCSKIIKNKNKIHKIAVIYEIQFGNTHAFAFEALFQLERGSQAKL